MEKLDIASHAFKSDEEFVKQMKEAYLNCPKAVKYINSIGLTDEEVDQNIAKIYSFVSDIKYCEKCPGVENCKKDTPTLCSKIVVYKGFVERQLLPCKKLMEKMNFVNQFIVKDFDDEWLNSELKKLENGTGRKEVVLKYRDIVTKNESQWLFINGAQHSGRSYLAATLVVDLAKKHRGPICYLNSSLRIKQLADMTYKNSAKFQETLELYSTCPVLVLDDFGNEYKTDFIRDAIVFEILNKRSSLRLLTIFTSDFSIDDIETLYATSKAGAIRARQIANIIRNNIKEEFNLGDLSAY